MARFLSSLLALVLFLSGCGYTRDSLLAPPETPTRAARKLGCVDLAVRTVADPRIPLTSAVVAFDFGNRCWHATPLDLSRVAVTGITSQGETILLTAHDPEQAIVPARLETSTQATEAIRYDAPKSHFDAHGLEPLAQVCVDISAVTDAAPSAPPLCFSAQGGTLELGRPDSVDLRRGPTGFGAEWVENAKPPVRVDVSVSGHSVQAAGLRLHDSTLGTFDGAQLLGERFSAATLDLRITGFVAGPLYVGGLVSVGGGGANRIQLQTRYGVYTTERAALHVPMGVVFGVSTPRVAGFEGRVEMVAGGRVTSAYASSGCEKDDCRRAIVGADWLVMPRVAVDFWITPFVSLSPWGGFDAAHLGDFSAGVAIAVHSRPFDGR